MTVNRKWMGCFLCLVMLLSAIIPGNAFATSGDINSISFDSDKEIVLTVGEDTEQLRIIASIEDASDKDVTNDVTWSTSDSKIVTVSGGLLTPVAKGTATITAKYKNAIATKTVTVQYAYSALTFDTADDTEFKLGTEDAAIKALADSTDVSSDAVWSTSDSSVVTVDEGSLTLVSEGTATITATYKGLKTSVEIEVVAPFETLAFSSDDDLEMVVGAGTSQLTVLTADSDDDENPVDVTSKVTWSSSDTSVATVEDGVVTPLTLGKATITATYLGSTAQKDVYVRNPYEAIILGDSSFVKNAVMFLNDSSKSVTAKVIDSSGAYEDVTSKAVWKTSNLLAASVSGGVITPKSAGTSTITVTYLGVSRSFTVTVYPTVTKFDVDTSDIEIIQGDSADVPEVTGTLLDETEKDFTKLVTWTSSDEDIFTVDSSKLESDDTGSAVLTATIGSVTVAEINVTVQQKVLVLMPDVESYQLIIGKTSALPNVTAVMENGDEADVTSDVTWTLSGTYAVIKDKSLKGLAKGSATLTGTYRNATVKIPVTVEAEVVTMVIDPQTIELNIKKSKSISVKGYYADGKSVSLSSKMNWVSSDNTVASVSGSTVKGVAIGTAKLTGTYQGKTYTVNVSVVHKLTKLTVSEKRFVLAPGASQSVTLTALYDTGETVNVTSSAAWTTSKSAVAKVSAGKIDAVAKGSATIKATYGGKTVSISVSVKQ
ncbi:Ig-like domain-containing protein [Paenibacillus pinistramenti]|uniref:Ig-like domain-containing protein n=1 Tax=Paenibacillus pinistramenti TaxID=1768003 RepID=UPI00110922F6|nr:Ig-like domain-containing protein [Paenibacillus pinistramenti]